MPDDNTKSFKKLALHLDKMPIGYPATESGVEIKILQELFTPIEAEIASVIDFAPKTASEMYQRIQNLGISEKELEKKLDEMYFKGLINRGVRTIGEKEAKLFSLAPLLTGIYEYQVDKLTSEFLEYFEQYMQEAFWTENLKTKIPRLRTIPIEKSITLEKNVSTYDELRNLIDNSGSLISVANCVCKQAEDMRGNPCKKTDMREHCFQFRSAAKSYV
ncbi:MAG: hypothetical protein ACFE8P_15950, partial [Promethearchaeota archaeon]